MAELILTPEEIAEHSWLDVDDATLGKAVKHMGLTLIPKMKADAARRWDGNEALYFSSYALLIGMLMDRENIGRFEHSIERTRTVDGEEVDNGTLSIVATVTGRK